MVMGFSPQVAPHKKPMQVHFFQNGKLADLERDINAWLAGAPHREIVDVRQSVGQSIVVSVWYID